MEKRKRATMIVNSDDEDLFNEVNAPKLKRPALEEKVDDLAVGPADFVEILTQAGFFLRPGDVSNQMSEHQSDFQQKLRDHFVSSIHYPRNIDFFLSDCEQFFRDENNFKKALQLTEVISKEEEVVTLPQESLVRLLLNIEEVQPKLMKIILNQLSKFANKNQSSTFNFPSSILSQMCWLNHVVEPGTLVNTLLDILNVAQIDVQREIISHLPGLVTDQEQIRVAFALCDMLKEIPLLTAAILDALGDLNLPTSEAGELRSQVVKRLSSVPLETIPILLTFVLKRVTSEDALPIISEIRCNLDRALKNVQPELSQQKIIVTDCRTLSIEALQNSLIRSRTLADAWFKVIQTSSAAKDHHTIDLVVLVIEHKLTGRSRQVEALIRTKTRSELISPQLLKETFDLYSSSLKNFFDALRYIADSLLVCKDSLVISSGSAFYKEMFIHFDGYYQQEVVQALIHHICCNTDIATSSESSSVAAVTVLQELAQQNWEDLVQLSAFVVTLLEYLDYMPLAQVRRIMELLGKLAYGFSPDDQSKTRWANFAASVQTELNMIIRKQLCHTRIEFQRMGVVGCVALVQNLADPELISGVSEPFIKDEIVTTIESNDDPLSGEKRLLQAKKLIDLAQNCTKHVPNVAALFMDEMANSVLVCDLHPILQSYLYESLAESFQEQFVVDVEELDTQSSPIPLSLQFGIDRPEDNPEVKLVFVNIGPMAILEHFKKKPEECAKKSTVTTLMSHFRLLRNTIDMHDEASLEDIDALLGCALCLPQLESIEDFMELSTIERDIACKCLFYAINWFIEVVNTFSRSRNPQMRAKVLCRLSNIVQLKEKLFRFLSKNVTFIPPQSAFFGEPVRRRFAVAVTAKRGKKTGKTTKKLAAKKSRANVSHVSQATILHSTPCPGTATDLNFTLTQKKSEAEEAAIPTSNICFRELDLSVFQLLSSPLELSGTDNVEPCCSLKAKELELLLSDLTLKIDHALVSTATKKRFPVQNVPDNGAFMLLDLYPAAAVAKRCVHLVKRLCSHLETISGYFKNLIDMNDGVLDGPGMFDESTLLLGKCYLLIFQILNRFLSWNEFQKTEHQSLLQDSLKHFAVRIKSDLGSLTQQDLTSTAFRYVEKFSETLPTFRCAVEHIHLLKSIIGGCSDSTLLNKLSAQAENILKRDWSATESAIDKGQKMNQGIEKIVQIYLSFGDNVFKKLETLISTTMVEVLQSEGKNGSSISFPIFTKTCFPVLYRVLLSALVEQTKFVTGNVNFNQSTEESLKFWSLSIRLLKEIVSVVRTVNKHVILSCCLKYGRIYLELFLKQAMPLLDKQFKVYRTDCQNLLKNLQSSTRILHHICTHSKVSRDASLAAHVPALKKALESFIYRVKAMLAANGCVDAFWLGNLKNKDLQGKEIHSQLTDSEESEDERHPSGESESENDEAVTVLEESNESGGEEISEEY